MNSNDSKRQQAKGWFLTWPKCPMDKKEALEILQETGTVVEYVVASELHADGTPHLHAFVKYASKVSFKANKWDLGVYHGNYQVAKCWKAVERYCKKDGDFISSIDIQSAAQKKAKNNKELLEMTPKEAVEQGKINLLQLPALIKARGMFNMLEEAKDHDSVRGIWYHGAPGVGKSWKARRENPGCFLKQQNKWWDGYEGQDVVLLDDFDKSGACLGHHMKIWADRYACTGEIKGGMIPLNFSKFIITSNYTPSEIWPDDEILCQAITRRFEVLLIE